MFPLLLLLRACRLGCRGVHLMNPMLWHIGLIQPSAKLEACGSGAVVRPSVYLLHNHYELVE